MNLKQLNIIWYVILSGAARYCKSVVARTKSRREAELYFCGVAKIKRFRYSIAETGSPLKVRYLCV